MIEELRIYLDEKSVTRTIPEKDITAFCTGCNDFQQHGVPCKNTDIGPNAQARHAVKRWCNWKFRSEVRPEKSS
jgi:hypothetical protein